MREFQIYAAVRAASDAVNCLPLSDRGGIPLACTLLLCEAIADAAEVVAVAIHNAAQTLSK